VPIQDDLCIHTGKNPWQNQNPEWETTERNFIYDDNGQLIKCTESRGKFDKVESWQIRYIGDKEVSFGHGGKHLEGTGLSANEANQAIAKDVVTKKKTLTMEQILVLLEKSRDTPIYMQVLFGVFMGLRRSEINGVKYSDIDYINRILKVERQLGRDVYADNREIIADGVPEIEEYMNMVFPDMEENELFKNELLEIVVDVTGFLPETA
jgi:integrase